MGRIRSLLLVAVLLTLGCEGAQGPVGPAGPSGPQGASGPAGSLNRQALFAAVTASGGATAVISAAAGASLSAPPDLACFLATSIANGVWLAVTDGGSTTAYCGLVLADGRWNAVMVRAAIGSTALFIVTW